MADRSKLLKQLFEVGGFQKMQDKISFATDIAMITVDFTGKPISKHSGCSEFCKRVRLDPKMNELCQICDSRGGIEAARINKPYIYTCHMGLIDFAIPITLNGAYVGAVMAGQIRLKDNNNALERVTSLQNEKEIKGALLSLYNALPSIPMDRIEALSDMIFHLYNYIIKEASAKIENFSPLESEKMFDTHKNSPTIKPAIKYIKENYTKEIRLDFLASLCDISPSYFSKLFKKIYNKNLSTFVNELRINLAKTLLEKTKKNIVSISYETGFEDCGYFIKVFKKVVGITPTSFRETYES